MGLEQEFVSGSQESCSLMLIESGLTFSPLRCSFPYSATTWNHSAADSSISYHCPVTFAAALQKTPIWWQMYHFFMFALLCCHYTVCSNVYKGTPTSQSSPKQLHVLKILALNSPRSTTMSDTHSSEKARRQREQENEQTMHGINQELSRLHRNAERAKIRAEIAAGSGARQGASQADANAGSGQGRTEKGLEEVGSKEDTKADTQAGAATGDPSKEPEKGPLEKSQFPR